MDKGSDVAIAKRVAENQHLNLFRVAWLVQMANKNGQRKPASRG